jgi:hypothetical protein
MHIGNPRSAIAIRAINHHAFFVANGARAGKSSIVTFWRQMNEKLRLDVLAQNGKNRQCLSHRSL